MASEAETTKIPGAEGNPMPNLNAIPANGGNLPEATKGQSFTKDTKKFVEYKATGDTVRRDYR